MNGCQRVRREVSEKDEKDLEYDGKLQLNHVYREPFEFEKRRKDQEETWCRMGRTNSLMPAHDDSDAV